MCFDYFITMYLILQNIKIQIYNRILIKSYNFIVFVFITNTRVLFFVYFQKIIDILSLNIIRFILMTMINVD